MQSITSPTARVACHRIEPCAYVPVGVRQQVWVVKKKKAVERMGHAVSGEHLLEIRDHRNPIVIVGTKDDAAIDVLHTRHFQEALVLAGDHVYSVYYDDAGRAMYL